MRTEGRMRREEGDVNSDTMSSPYQQCARGDGAESESETLRLRANVDNSPLLESSRETFTAASSRVLCSMDHLLTLPSPIDTPSWTVRGRRRQCWNYMDLQGVRSPHSPPLHSVPLTTASSLPSPHPTVGSDQCDPPLASIRTLGVVTSQ